MSKNAQKPPFSFVQTKAQLQSVHTTTGPNAFPKYCVLVVLKTLEKYGRHGVKAASDVF